VRETNLKGTGGKIKFREEKESFIKEVGEEEQRLMMGTREMMTETNTSYTNLNKRTEEDAMVFNDSTNKLNTINNNSKEDSP